VDAGQLFSGSALGEVAPNGAVRLPEFVRRVIERRSAAERLVLGVHESDPCVTAHASGQWPAIEAEIERRRLRDEAAGAPSSAHHQRARRAFGLAEEAAADRRGRILLPELMRRRGRIGGLALFVGTGASFEIWNPDVALETGDEELRELAEFRLSERAQRRDSPRRRRR
jgi:MraZ protein